MAITDQKISETTPNTFSVVTRTGCGSDGLKIVCTVYSGLVPMSPNTTPRAPSSRAPRAALCLIVLPVGPFPHAQHSVRHPALGQWQPGELPPFSARGGWI